MTVIEPAREPRPGDIPAYRVIGEGLSGRLRVTGTLFQVGDDLPMLCSGVAESYPPQCAYQEGIHLSGLDLATVPGLQVVEDTRWTDLEISVVGDVEARP